MEKERLQRRVYITYKARINTAERLKRTESFIQGLNIYYSLFLTALSIYTVTNSSQKLSLVLIIASVVVTVSIVFLSTKRYAERAKDLKNNYIMLDQLYRDICDANDIDELDKLGKQYTVLLNNSENHTEYDYYNAIKNMKDESDTLSKKQTVRHYARAILKWSLISLLVAVPFLIRYVANVIEWIIQM